MTDAFDEVEEDIRRDRIMEFLRKWGPWLIGALVAVVAGIALWGFLQTNMRQQSAAQAEAAADAREKLEAGDFAAAASAFEKAAAGAQGDQKALLLMQQAEAVLGQNAEPGAAVALLDEAAGAARDPLVRDAARLKAAFAAADTEDFAALEARLKPLIEKRSAYASLARELLALQAYAAGDFARARTEFEFLRLDLDAPQNVRDRAEAGIAMLPPTPAPTPPAAAEPTPPQAASDGDPAP